MERVNYRENALIIHYTRNDHLLRDGELVLMDAGGEYKYALPIPLHAHTLTHVICSGYASDICEQTLPPLPNPIRLKDPSILLLLSTYLPRQRHVHSTTTRSLRSPTHNSKSARERVRRRARPLARVAPPPLPRPPPRRAHARRTPLRRPCLGARPVPALPDASHRHRRVPSPPPLPPFFFGLCC